MAMPPRPFRTSWRASSSVPPLASWIRFARSQQATPSGTLRINAFPTAAREIFPWLVLPFLRMYPQVHVDIVSGGFDLGVRSIDLVPADMIAVPLGVARRNVVVGTPSYLKAHGTPMAPQNLAEHCCLRVRLPDGAIYRWPFEKDGQSVHIDVEGAITLDEASLARSAALASVGLALAMESDVRDDIEAGRLVRVLEDWTRTLSPLSLYYPSRRNPTAAFKAFINFARRHSGGSDAPGLSTG
ncbi:MAG: LysR substrate-binding domain-containing protein [Ferrovibrio sp.]|uniref:LysR substrate-binding domain-containing protein n=1 Tax=Ferrovibrio sp. TaxID=1917215 RepID=UPI002621DE1C|nr:LysR substrate-binding domain-containing protein [Ferrovibrio sp.]MCW0232108.1 LysR substrate-binding domain-containing protein [Ferrovibrio sp.]